MYHDNGIDRFACFKDGSRHETEENSPCYIWPSPFVQRDLWHLHVMLCVPLHSNMFNVMTQRLPNLSNPPLHYTITVVLQTLSHLSVS